MTYCERTGPGVFDEPVNAATNAVFFIAAWAAWWLARRRHVLAAELWVLIGLSVAIGIGSTLWHTFATPWASPLDVIPILLFQLNFIWIYGRRLAGIRAGAAALILTVYLCAAILLRQYEHWLNGLPIYAPALLLTLTLGVYHWQSGKREPLLLLAAAGAFCLALFFRTIDRWICPCCPIGTHFLWHMFNGLVVYLAMRSLIVNAPPPPGSSDFSKVQI